MQQTSQCVLPDEANSKKTSPSPSANRTNLPANPAYKTAVLACVWALILLPAAGFGGYLLGVPIPGLPAGEKEPKPSDEKKKEPQEPGVSLVKNKPHTLDVPQDVRENLGIRKGKRDLLAIARTPSTKRELELPGSTALDPTRLARIRARFAPARVVEIGQIRDFSTKTGRTILRELRPGDHVRKGDLLGVFYSVDVGSKKNDLLDSLIQLELDQKILDEAEKHRNAVSESFWLAQVRAVQGDRNAINRALNNLEVWDIPQEEIDALHDEAKKISADQKAWFKTREGRWVNGEKQNVDEKNGQDKKQENPWGRVTLRAPFDGVIVERNLHVGEMIVDNTVNLFQIADVSRLLVIANAPEDELPTLEALFLNEREWAVHTVGTATAAGVTGTIDEIGYLIDPNQHTAVVKGYVDNPAGRIRGGQYVTATVKIPPPEGVVEIPNSAVSDDGKQCVVFVQTDPTKPQFTMRRVQVTHRFERTVFVRSTEIPKKEQLSGQEGEEGLLPKEPLRAGEHVLQTGVGELKAALLSLEAKSEKE
jgi:cobalt-zinc-cadmium efflux system membrane fusion protein